MVWILSCLQVVNWAIEQKQEKQMEKAMSDIGVRFQFFEVQGDDGKSSVKWSSLDGRFWPGRLTGIPWMYTKEDLLFFFFCN